MRQKSCEKLLRTRQEIFIYKRNNEWMKSETEIAIPILTPNLVNLIEDHRFISRYWYEVFWGSSEQIRQYHTITKIRDQFTLYFSYKILLNLLKSSLSFIKWETRSPSTHLLLSRTTHVPTLIIKPFLKK